MSPSQAAAAKAARAGEKQHLFAIEAPADAAAAAPADGAAPGTPARQAGPRREQFACESDEAVNAWIRKLQAAIEMANVLAESAAEAAAAQGGAMAAADAAPTEVASPLGTPAPVGVTFAPTETPAPTAGAMVRARVRMRASRYARTPPSSYSLALRCALLSHMH